jgi:hypothetical protein
MSDYVPQSDAEFNLWQVNLTDNIDSNLTAWGILAEDFTAMGIFQNSWTTAFAKANNKQNRTSADVQAKDDARDAYEKSLRKFVAQWLANNSKIANSDRERMGLTIKSGSRTPVPVPVTFPIGTIDFSVRLRHTLHFSDQATPSSRAKPDGVHGCEIWTKIDGVAPTDPSELDYLATNTRSSYTKDFEGKYAGKTVWYWMRWVNKRGEAGPWSSPISAMVVS